MKDDMKSVLSLVNFFAGEMVQRPRKLKMRKNSSIVKSWFVGSH